MRCTANVGPIALVARNPYALVASSVLLGYGLYHSISTPLYIPSPWLVQDVSTTTPLTIPLDNSTTDDIVRDITPFNYATYTKTNLETGKVYVGRTSGYGTPEQIVNNRDYNHHMSALGYGKAVLSTSAPATIPGGYTTRAMDPSYWSIRGSEQLQIEYYRELGISGNGVNGIGSNNPNGSKYLDAARKFFDY